MPNVESALNPVHAFADPAWEQFLELNPLWATMQGDERWDDRLDDPGPDGRAAMLATAEAWEAEMEGFGGLELSVHGGRSQSQRASIYTAHDVGASLTLVF